MKRDKLDLLIIGSGPAGLSAADTAHREGLDYLVIEAGYIADTIYRYPIGLPVFSTPEELELRPDTLHPVRDKPTREELLTYYVQFVIEQDLRINTEERALRIEADEDGDFLVHTTKYVYAARRVLVTVGGFARPRRLNVLGEDLPHVFHRFREAFPYVRRNALVIGGGNSAAEAALFLAEGGAHTSIAILRSDWENHDPKKGAIKHWVREPLEREIERGRLRLILLKETEEIGEGFIRLTKDDGEELLLPNDVVFILIGSDADLTLLREAGVEIYSEGISEFPVYDVETFETNVSGIYVAGHFTQSRHIAQAIAVPRRIVPLIAQGLRTAAHA
jgi:thioredoxin reductase (NADPH)